MGTSTSSGLENVDAKLIASDSAFLEPLDYTNRNATEKVFIDVLVLAATEYIENYCNRKFVRNLYCDEVHNGGRFPIDSIYLKNPPIGSIGHINITDNAFQNTTTTRYGGTRFDFDPETGEVRWKPGSFTDTGLQQFPAGFQNILATYIGGYEQIPRPIQIVAANFVLEHFDPGLIAQNIEKEKLGDYFYALGTNAWDKYSFKVKSLLNRYKILRV